MKLYRRDLTDMNKLDNYIKAKDMKEYFLQLLQLNYQEMTSIEQILKKNENSSFAPRTLLAACAYAFLKESKIAIFKRQKYGSHFRRQCYVVVQMS